MSRKFLALGSAAMMCAACARLGIDKQDERGTTALMRAAARGDTAEVGQMIARGADVNAEVPRRDLREIIAFASGDQDLPVSDIGYTPLLYAAKSRNPRVVGILVDNGADVHHATRAGVTAFRIAFDRSDVRIMRLLTVAGVRPTPEQLARAVERSPAEVVGLLLQRGADPNAYLHPGNKAPIVVTATKRGDPEIVRLVIEAKANVNARDVNGWTPLRWARDAQIRQKSPGAPQLIALLEAAGARDDGGVKAVALLDAVRQQDVARVRDALRSGANPNARDNNSVRPLVHAATQGSTEIVAALIAAGAHLNLSAFAPYGPSPLTAAIENGHVAVVKQLLAAGANSDQRDGRGLTPLMAASINKRAEMTALLLADSAKAEPRAFYLAVRNASTGQIRMFLDHGADPNAFSGGALREAARGCRDRDNTDVMRLLLERGADPKAVKFEHLRFYLLHTAAQWCTPQAIALLVERGADPNALDNMRRTPLIVAAGAGKLENVRALIAAGADLKPQDKTGKTALQYAGAFPDVQEALRQAALRQSKLAGR